MTDPYLPAIEASEALSDPRPLIDVRKATARDGAPDIAGTRWIDPFRLDHDHPLIEAAVPVIFFCVHGHEVSRYACALARLHRIDAAYVEGGYEALVTAGARRAP
ncbi:sulfurtransferase [Pontivivens ytuae]|uniref:Sulfurtransferase n=1 Tax=Pontivivens ytuae TaxID=2789856 RepID=A0A7S9LRR8_9RHOB|nr:sulfurtransferase [Pontivivens ytuae]QPH54058.1 sulfurtransferase [Pontivivens ytuae]